MTEPLYPFGLDDAEREGTEEMLTMTRIDDIRRAYFEEGRTISGISAEYDLDRKTVRKYVMKEDFNAVVPSVGREAMQPKLDPYKKTIDEWLEGDMKARRKQRHTAKRVYDRLVETHAGFDCSYRMDITVSESHLSDLYGAASPMKVSRLSGKEATPRAGALRELRYTFAESPFFGFDTLKLTT